MGQNWIQVHRKRVGISQDQLAARLQVRGFDIVRATISHWERGRYNPPLGDPQFCKALADILRIDVKTLLMMAGYDLAPEVSDIAGRVAYLVNQLPAEKQRLALSLVEVLLTG